MQSKVHVSRSNRAFLSPTRENGSVQGLRKARFERETWTLLCIAVRGKNQRSAEINSDRTPLRAYRF